MMGNNNPNVYCVILITSGFRTLELKGIGIMRNARKSAFLLHVVVVGLLGSTCLVRAQMETATRGSTNGNNEGRAPRRWSQNERITGEPIGERLLDRLLANAKLTTELGLTDETVAKLREESHALQLRSIDLNAQIRKLSLDQADRMSKLLVSADANSNEVMMGVEEIGRLRTEQAKLAVQQLMVVRKYLTPDQIRKAHELMRERMQKNAEAHSAKKEKNATSPTGSQPTHPPEGW